MLLLQNLSLFILILIWLLIVVKQLMLYFLYKRRYTIITKKSNLFDITFKKLLDIQEYSGGWRRSTCRPVLECLGWRRAPGSRWCWAWPGGWRWRRSRAAPPTPPALPPHWILSLSPAEQLHRRANTHNCTSTQRLYKHTPTQCSNICPAGQHNYITTGAASLVLHSTRTTNIANHRMLCSIRTQPFLKWLRIVASFWNLMEKRFLLNFTSE